MAAVAPKLSPQAKIDRGQRLQAEGRRLEIEGVLEMHHAANDWVDQASSPLGRKKHLRLARLGVIPSRKDGRQVLVKRDDLNAYLEKNGLARGGKSEQDEDLDDLIERVNATEDRGGKRR